MRNVLAEFESRKYGKRKPTILGLREHIFTGRYAHIPKYLFVAPCSCHLYSKYVLLISLPCFCIIVSSLAWFMSNQETSFVTIGQRVLANPLKYENLSLISC